MIISLRYVTLLLCSLAVIMINGDAAEDVKSDLVTPETTRIFVSGLPPKFTNVQLAAHFGSQFKVTDAHVIADRRIGFVGFVDSATAQNAAKHFNKTYVRMSRIAVDLAKPVELTSGKGGNSAPISQKRQRGHTEERSGKRKRSQEDDGENLRSTTASTTLPKDVTNAKKIEEDESVDAAAEHPADLDWLRGRTSRTLDLLDPDEVRIRQDEDDDPAEDAVEQVQEEADNDSNTNDTVATVPNARLFLRNLAFSITEQDLRRHFEQFGKVQEVSNLPSILVSTTPS